MPGERFDFELNMLIESGQLQIPVEEFPVRPADEIGCYSSLTLMNLFSIFKRFLMFVGASISCFIIDILLFSIFVLLLKHFHISDYILIATVAARILSSLTNYLMNRDCAAAVGVRSKKA